MHFLVEIMYLSLNAYGRDPLMLKKNDSPEPVLTKMDPIDK